MTTTGPEDGLPISGALPAGARPDLRRSAGALPGRPKPFDASAADPNETYRAKCPACGSAKVRVLIPAGEDDNLFKFGNFRVFQDRQCKGCGRVWTPACPRWAAYCCVAAGVLLFGGAAALAVVLAVVYRDGGWIAGLMCGIFPGVGGAFSLVYGVGALTGRLGRLKMW